MQARPNMNICTWLLIPTLALAAPLLHPIAYQEGGPCTAHLIALLSALPENGAFFCNECDCRFSEEASLKRHSLQVHSDKPYKCDRCQASFRYKGNLASHKTVHTGTVLAMGTALGRLWVGEHVGVYGWVCAGCSILYSVSRAVPDGKSKVLYLALPESPWTEHQAWEWGRYLPLQRGWNATSFAVKHWAPLFLKVSCKMHRWEQMRSLR